MQGGKASDKALRVYVHVPWLCIGLVDCPRRYARTKALLLEHEDDLRAVAELLLEKETINVDDVINLVGPRPFKMPSSYADFLKRAWQADPDEKDEEIEDGSVAVDIGLATMERYESDWERQIEAARRSRR